MRQQRYPGQAADPGHQADAVGGTPRGRGQAGRPVLGGPEGLVQVHRREERGNHSRAG